MVAYMVSWVYAQYAIAIRMNGEPGNTERRVIQNKVQQQLKLLNRVDYLQMLSVMGIQTANPYLRCG
jgi:hypothetical protein